jgi:hypothetical protein
LIGETIIDLENRYYLPTWRKFKHNIIETRNLYHPSSSISRGRIRLWCDIIKATDIENVRRIWDIKPKPPLPFELRVIVWSTADIPNNDIEDASDIYVKVRVGDNVQKTDVHYRCQNGEVILKSPNKIILYIVDF